MPDQEYLTTFQQFRSQLLGLSYRILGSRADAEDAVQETFIKWQQADRTRILEPGKWLRTICIRTSIDQLRSAHRARVNYVGTWLPEPVLTDPSGPQERAQLLSASLTTAFLLMLERLTPKERAAWLLYELLETDYGEIAEILEIRESTCRQLVSRARRHISKPVSRHATPRERQDELIKAFQAAVAGRGTDQLAAMLAEDIALHADGGGVVRSARRVIHGKQFVLRFIEKVLGKYWRDGEWVVTDINGGRGVILRQGPVIHAAISFMFDETGTVTGMYIMRNPHKLNRLDDGLIR